MRVSVPAKTGLSDLPYEAREGRGDAAARGEHGKHPDHDGRISGRQDFYECFWTWRLRKMDAKVTPHGHEESVLTSHQALSWTADDLPEHKQSSSGFPRVQRGDRCGGRLSNEVAGELPT